MVQHVHEKVMKLARMPRATSYSMYAVREALTAFEAKVALGY